MARLCYLRCPFCASDVGVEFRDLLSGHGCLVCEQPVWPVGGDVPRAARVLVALIARMAPADMPARQEEDEMLVDLLRQHGFEVRA